MCVGRSPLANLNRPSHPVTPQCQRIDPGFAGTQALMTRYWHGPFGRLTLTGTASGLLRAVFSGEQAAAQQPLPAPWYQPSTHVVVLLLGTDLQCQVWQALATIQPGERVSYAGLAQRIGRPKAIRAVASAVAANPLPIILPCHRIIRSDGRYGQYLGGTARKRQLLEAERL